MHLHAYDSMYHYVSQKCTVLFLQQLCHTKLYVDNFWQKHTSINIPSHAFKLCQKQRNSFSSTARRGAHTSAKRNTTSSYIACDFLTSQTFVLCITESRQCYRSLSYIARDFLTSQTFVLCITESQQCYRSSSYIACDFLTSQTFFLWITESWQCYRSSSYLACDFLTSHTFVLWITESRQCYRSGSVDIFYQMSMSWGVVCSGVTRGQARGVTPEGKKFCGQIYKEKWRNEVGQVKKCRVTPSRGVIPEWKQ